MHGDPSKTSDPAVGSTRLVWCRTVKCGWRVRGRWQCGWAVVFGSMGKYECEQRRAPNDKVRGGAKNQGRNYG
jgi:hypothetical protein